MSVEDSVKVVEVLALNSDPPVIVDEATPVREVLTRMRAVQAPCALVTREEKLTGLFTECDSFFSVLETKGGLDQPVSEWMTPDPVTVGEHDPIRKAVIHMCRDGFRSIPVVDAEGRILSCVRQRDIVRYIVRHFPQHALNIPPDPEQVATSREGG